MYILSFAHHIEEKLILKDEDNFPKVIEHSVRLKPLLKFLMSSLDQATPTTKGTHN